MTRRKKTKPVVIYAQTALFLYKYLGRLEPAGPGSAKALKIVMADLRQALEDIGIDPDAPVEQLFGKES